MPARAAGTLDTLFAPTSVAVIGASRREGSVGHTLFRNILSAEYSGVVYPVNRHWESVGGVRCFPSVAELPQPPELAVVIVPAPDVASTLLELAQRGTRNAVIVSSGFKEIGGDGVRREEEIVRIATRYGMRLVGPNCFGVINTAPGVRLNATFSDVLPPTGSIAFISQSGALGHGILRHAHAMGIGFTKFVSVGNRAGIDETDLLQTLGEDDSTRVILLYLESLANGRRFLEVAREVTARKPVLLIKSGRTALGEQAVRSHTGNLAHAHSDRLFDAVFDEAGVLRAGSISELFQMARIFSASPLPRGGRLAILTNSGGPGILAADAAARAALTLPGLPERTRRRLAPQLPPHSSVRNPLDITADAKSASYAAALKGLLGEDSIDSILLIATPTGETTGRAVAETVVKTAERQTKPLVTCLFGIGDLSEEVSYLEAHGIPNFTFPEEAASALAHLAAYAEIRARTPETPTRFPVRRYRIRAPTARGGQGARPAMPDEEVHRLLESYGFALPPSRTIRTEAEALEAAQEIGYPVVLKAVSPDILHKTDAGAVALHLANWSDLVTALGAMRERLRRGAPRARIEGFRIEKEIRGGTEVILGIKRDPDFGPVLLFGLGGVFVEALEDVNFRPAPVTRASVKRLLASVRGTRLLEGMRGEPPRDLPALEEAIARLSQLAVEQERIAELDINPLLVLPRGQGVFAVDCRVITT